MLMVIIDKNVNHWEDRDQFDPSTKEASVLLEP